MLLRECGEEHSYRRKTDVSGELALQLQPAVFPFIAAGCCH